MLWPWKKFHRVCWKVWKFVKEDRWRIQSNFPEHALEVVISELSHAWNKSSIILEIADKGW